MKRTIATISELNAIPYQDNGEPLVDLEKVNSTISSTYRRNDSGLTQVLVRKHIAEKLAKVQKNIIQYSPHMRLLVVEGYRTLAYQEKYYLQELLREFQRSPLVDFDVLLERTHQFVALPTVAGHPTGGAIDLTITYRGEELDLGGKIADFNFPQFLPTLSNLINPEQTKWRILLHDLMLEQGFAPFYGEWWHFSYGDREWAAFYQKPEALYTPIFNYCPS